MNDLCEEFSKQIAVRSFFQFPISFPAKVSIVNALSSILFFLSFPQRTKIRFSTSSSSSLLVCMAVHPFPASLPSLLLLRNLSGLAGARQWLARLLVKQPVRLLARLANLLKHGRLEVGLCHHGGRLAGEVDLEGLDVCVL